MIFLPHCGIFPSMQIHGVFAILKESPLHPRIPQPLPHFLLFLSGKHFEKAKLYSSKSLFSSTHEPSLSRLNQVALKFIRDQMLVNSCQKHLTQLITLFSCHLLPTLYQLYSHLIVLMCLRGDTPELSPRAFSLHLLPWWCPVLRC